MQIVVPAETEENERRVGLTPESVKKLVRLGFRVSVEDGIGEKAGYSNDEYSEAGSDISTDRDKLLSEGDIIARVRKPSIEEISKFKTGSMHVSYLDPYNDSDLVDRLAQQGVTAISMEMIPRTTRAQKMGSYSEPILGLFFGAQGSTNLWPMIAPGCAATCSFCNSKGGLLSD